MSYLQIVQFVILFFFQKLAAKTLPRILQNLAEQLLAKKQQPNNIIYLSPSRFCFSTRDRAIKASQHKQTKGALNGARLAQAQKDAV